MFLSQMKMKVPSWACKSSVSAAVATKKDRYHPLSTSVTMVTMATTIQCDAHSSDHIFRSSSFKNKMECMRMRVHLHVDTSIYKRTHVINFLLWRERKTRIARQVSLNGKPAAIIIISHDVHWKLTFLFASTRKLNKNKDFLLRLIYWAMQWF